MGYHTVVAGQTITAANHNTHIRDQVTVPFATTSARTSAVSSPVQGMVSYRTDLGSGGNLEHYNGSAWVPTAAQLISSTTLGAGAATVTFSSIPGVYSSLLLTGLGNLSGTGNMVDCTVRFNGDNGSNYTYASWDATQAALNPAGSFANAATVMNWAFGMAGTSFGGNQSSGFLITIPGYSNTTHRKILLNHGNWCADNGTNMNAKVRFGFWQSTTAITTILLTSGSGNFATGTHFGLYGLP